MTKREHWVRADRPDFYAEEIDDAALEAWDFLDPDLGDEYQPMGEGGLNICPYCGAKLWPPTEPVVGHDGRRYDDPLASDPSIEWYCPACWKQRETERRRRDNASLADFEP